MVAAPIEPEHSPLWPSGTFVVLTEAEVSKHCVEAFQQSATRENLFRDFSAVLARLEEVGVRGEVWLDGSFVTTKANPADIDFVLFTSAEQYDASPELRPVLDALIDNTPEWPPSTCDTNASFFDDSRGYWERRFGTQPAKGLPKGIVIVRLREEERK